MAASEVPLPTSPGFQAVTMGQSSSTQRDHRISLSDHLGLSRIGRDQGYRDDEMDNGRDFEQFGQSGPTFGAEISNGNIQTSSSALPGAATDTSGQSALGDMRSTQGENGSDFGLGQQEYRSPTFARMAARRQSTMSRLGSRILPNSVIRGLLNSQEETPAEGHAHRHGVSRSIPRSEAVHNSSRFSPFSSLSSRGINRRRSPRGPYFFPRSETALPLDTTAGPAYLDPGSERVPEPNRGSWRRSARLHRVRRSLSNPISQMFGQQSLGISSPDNEGVPRPPSRSYLSDDSDNLFAPSRALDSRMDFDEPHELDSVDPAVRNARPDSTASNQSTQGPTGARQLPGFLRARPSRVLRREEQTPLTRVLQLAAAAIASQLSGTAGPVLPNIQSLGNDGLDGSLEGFIQSLQNATSAQTNSAASNGSTTNATADNNTPPPPVNFLRVFRFANSDTARSPGTTNRPPESDNTSRQADGMDVDNPSEGTGTEGRTVTLVVVGVRSVPSGNGPGGDQPNPGNGMDALVRLPFLSPGMRNQEGGPTLPTRNDGLPRLFPNPNPLGVPGALSPHGDASRQSGPSNTSRRLSDAGAGSPLSSLPSSLPESPPGPHPPPSTPADPGLSTVSSGASTPSRRPSSASAMSPSFLPQIHENHSMQPTVEPAEHGIPNIAHQRRRSDSEYARHRDLGSGSVRRNGVVEPDNPTPPAGRSWLIYVVGTNVSENHPAFATPSLFTDNPTYEDMILLSSLLGPAKPPVASQEDVSSSGGLFRLVEYAGSLVAEAVDGTGTMRIPEGDRCLICLSDYEAAEELRKLNKCEHAFHRDCIDQWLTTGRNSCPLCRGQGVTETQNTNPAQGPSSTAV